MIESSNTTDPNGEHAASSGVEGLDQILRGGFPRDEMHLIEGGAGTGKTTLALRFLLAGIGKGESGLYITLSQTQKGLEAIARSHGWSLEGIAVRELSSGSVDRMAAHQTVLRTAEVELDELTRDIRELIEQAAPRRLVFDSIGVLRLLSGSESRYHVEIVSLRQFLAGKGCTSLFLGDRAAEKEEGQGNNEFHSLAASIVHLEQTAPDYGEVRRRVRVIKVRGVPFQGGYHNFRIQRGGLEVYPRLGMHAKEYKEFKLLQSGLEPLDALLGGGLEQGTSCLFVGPPGAGKSTLASLYARSAAQRGGAAVIFLLDERVETWKVRSAGLGLDCEPFLEDGRLSIQQIDTAQITPGEFAQLVRKSVEDRKATVVVIDSLTGYFNALGNTPMLAVQMHELLNFLSVNGVLTLLLVSQEGFMTVGSHNTVDVSYLSDSIFVVGLFEAEGVVRRFLSVVKKRHGEHETTIREFFINPGGVNVADAPLKQFRHILGGDPTPVGGGQRGEGGSDVA